MTISRGLVLRLVGAGLGLLVVAWYTGGWLVSGLPFLIAMAMIMAGCGAYAGWQAVAFIELIAEKSTPARTVVQPVGPLEVPALSKSRATKVRQTVAALAAENVFAPETPDAAALFGPIADRDEPPNQEVVLTALWEANYYDPGFDPDKYMTNLAFHDNKGEQFAETIADQLADLSRLCGGDLPISNVSIHHPLVDGLGPQPRCAITLDAGSQRIELSYVPAAKYLSTLLHVAIAKALRESGSARRLAWLWNDQGTWISALGEGGVERLNTGPGAVRGGYGGWEWLDLVDPYAAGEVT